jgi:polysaccharide pyruvyl transferase WcaK-like protein
MRRDGIYLYGYYGQGNLGDDLLMLSAVRMIRATRADAKIFVHCHDAACLPKLGDPLIIPIEASAILADQSVARPLRLKRYFSLLRHTFKACDTLVFGGGTVLQESRSPMSIMLIAAMVSIAKRRGLEVVLLGAGLGEFKTRLGGFAARHVLRRVRATAFRDEESAVRAMQMVPHCPVVRTADLVYALQSSSRDTHAITGGAVALSIQPSVTERTDALGERTRNTLRGLVEVLVERGRHVRLLVFESKPDHVGGIDDGRAWRALLGDLLDRHPSQLTLADGSDGSADAPAIRARLFAGCSVHAGMRFHGQVLASQSGLPFVGLSHDTKVAEICRVFAMPCVSAESSSTADVVQALAAAEKLVISTQTLDELRTRSLANQNVLASALGKS